MVAHFSSEILENGKRGEISITAQLCHQSGDYLKSSGQAVTALSLVPAGLRAAPLPPPQSRLLSSCKVSPPWSPSKLNWMKLRLWGWGACLLLPHAYSYTFSAYVSSVKQGYCFMLSNRSHKNSHSIYAISASGPSPFCPILYETCLASQGACYLHNDVPTTTSQKVQPVQSAVTSKTLDAGTIDGSK